MDDDNFDSVQWGDASDHGSLPPVPSVTSPPLGPGGIPELPTSPQAGPNADAMDLAGVGRARLDTKVTDPQTEGEGTKDAYVSYHVITDVCGFPTVRGVRSR